METPFLDNLTYEILEPLETDRVTSGIFDAFEYNISLSDFAQDPFQSSFDTLQSEENWASIDFV